MLPQARLKHKHLFLNRASNSKNRSIKTNLEKKFWATKI